MGVDVHVGHCFGFLVGWEEVVGGWKLRVRRSHGGLAGFFERH